MNTTKTRRRPAIKDLSAAALAVEATHQDWTQGYGEKWEAYEVSECGHELKNGDYCTAPVMGREECPKNPDHGERGESNEGPMMNYAYALPNFEYALRERFGGDARAAAEAISHLPLCLVHFEDADDEDQEWALALTGGGMDLSWEICAAYVALGYLPPLAFAGRLPDMSKGRGWLRTLSACRASFQVSTRQARWAVAKLRDLRAKMTAKEAR